MKILDFRLYQVCVYPILMRQNTSDSWTVVKTMNRALPPDAELSQEVIDAMEACMVWFIQSTTAEGAAPFVSPTTHGEHEKHC